MSKFDYLFITDQPSFYKVRLWNEIAKSKQVLLVFLDKKKKDRHLDFVSAKPEFNVVFSPSGFLKRMWFIANLIIKTQYKQLIIGGWDEPCFLLIPFISPKDKNAFLCESSIYEYRPHILKDCVKRLFLKRISMVYLAGKAQGRLLEQLNYKGSYLYTGGCGILNYINQPEYAPRNQVDSFLYVGRLAKVKNLEVLVSVFNELPRLKLNIIGYGEEEEKLKEMSSPNIVFLGPKENKELTFYYQQADVFILPSSYEPWGLVVEEALNNGTPVIVSDKVGCRDDLVSNNTGIVFNSGSVESLRRAIIRMTDINFYNSLRKNIAEMNFEERRQQQINSFIHAQA